MIVSKIVTNQVDNLVQLAGKSYVYIESDASGNVFKVVSDSPDVITAAKALGLN